MTIFFYKLNDKYGCFSNFYHCDIYIDNKKWMSSEHYYQAQKFSGTIYEEIIRNINNPMKAAIIGRDKNLPLRKDWDTIKDSIMKKAVLCKFKQNENLKEVLLSTGNQRIVENTSDDYYWGCGKLKNGKNMLGIILMQVRNEIK